MKKLKQLLLLGGGLFFSQSLGAQLTTVNLTTANGLEDAMVINGGVENINFGSQNEMHVYNQFQQQIPMSFRTFLKYDLTSIPQNAIIVSAQLKIVSKTINNSQSHPFFIERAEGPWTENTITWNNQPNAIAADQILIPGSQNSAPGTHTFDVTGHIQYMACHPADNYGWRIRLQQEGIQREYGVRYHSSEATSSSDQPVLTVEYMLPIEMTTSVSHATAGNNDGTLSMQLNGGTTYGIGNMFFYKTNRDLAQLGRATLSNAKITNNLQFDPVTKIVTAENLEPGIYILRVLDAQYYATNNINKYAFYKHILVGREGEVTSGILLPNRQYQENTTIAKDKPTANNFLDRANTNYHTEGNLIPLRVADAPNSYEYASLIKYQLDFDDQLEFTKADLSMYAWSKYFRHHNSSNAVNFNLATSNWEEESVTWNTRPSVDLSNQLYLPTTTVIGYDNDKWDSISILPFVEYWQDHPTDNYGFEMVLETYGATQYAQRSHRSTANNNNFIEFEFTVKSQESTTYNEETQRGTFTVNAPSGNPLPYKYLISSQELPELNVIWNNVKDSIPVDSATFFAGDINQTSFVFEDLDVGQYYVGVYDNNGVKILDEQGVIAPEIVLLDNANVDLSNDILSVGPNGSTASAVIDGFLAENESGGFEFTVGTVGDMTIGLNNFSQSKPLTNLDFEYAIAFASDNSFDVLKNGIILYEGTTQGNDVFGVYKENQELIFVKNSFELTRSIISSNDQIDLTAAINLQGAGTLSNIIKIGKYKPRIKPLKTLIEPVECGETLGRVTALPITLFFASGSGTYAIIDRSTSNTVASGSTIDLTAFDGGIELPIGDYKIEYSYTVSGVTFNYSYLFVIGHPIYWNILNDYFIEIDGTTNTIANGSLDLGLAISQNNLSALETGWVSFNASLKKYYPPLGGGIPFAPSKVEVKMVNEALETQAKINVFLLGSGIFNKYVWARDASGTILSTFETYREGPYRIERVASGSDWEYQFTFNNNVLPFAVAAETGGIDHQSFRTFASGTNTSIYESYASFCGFESIRSYADLTKKLDGGYYLARNGIVKFIYNEEYNDLDDQLSYSIYDASNDVVVSDTEIAQTVVYGDNRYDLDFSSFTGDIALENGFYVLEVMNEKLEKWYLRFKITDN